MSERSVYFKQCIDRDCGAFEVGITRKTLVKVGEICIDLVFGNNIEKSPHRVAVERNAAASRNLEITQEKILKAEVIVSFLYLVLAEKFKLVIFRIILHAEPSVAGSSYFVAGIRIHHYNHFGIRRDGSPYVKNKNGG